MEIRNPRLAKMATGNTEEDLFLLRFSMYIYTVVRRTAGRYWEKQRLLERMEISVDSYDMDSTFESRGYQFSGIDVQFMLTTEGIADELLLAALKTLTEKQRCVVMAYIVNDCPVKEIAKQRNMAPVSVYDLLSHGLARLRQFYEGM